MAQSRRALPLAGQPDCESVMIFMLQEDSRYKSMVGGLNDFVLFTRVSGGRGFAMVRDPEAACPAPATMFRDKDLDDYYGVTENRTFWTGWVPPPGLPTTPAPA